MCIPGKPVDLTEMGEWLRGMGHPAKIFACVTHGGFQAKSSRLYHKGSKVASSIAYCTVDQVCAAFRGGSGDYPCLVVNDLAYAYLRRAWQLQYVGEQRFRYEFSPAAAGGWLPDGYVAEEGEMIRISSSWNAAHRERPGEDQVSAAMNQWVICTGGGAYEGFSMTGDIRVATLGEWKRSLETQLASFLAPGGALMYGLGREAALDLHAVAARAREKLGPPRAGAQTHAPAPAWGGAPC